MVKRKAEALYVFKIMNEDVINGSKAIGDPGEYELVDILANETSNGSWNIAGDSIVFNTRVDLRRKPHIQGGVNTAGDGFGTTAENSDWIVLLEENILDHPEISSLHFQIIIQEIVTDGNRLDDPFVDHLEGLQAHQQSIPVIFNRFRRITVIHSFDVYLENIKCKYRIFLVTVNPV